MRSTILRLLLALILQTSFCQLQQESWNPVPIHQSIKSYEIKNFTEQLIPSAPSYVRLVFNISKHTEDTISILFLSCSPFDIELVYMNGSFWGNATGTYALEAPVEIQTYTGGLVDARIKLSDLEGVQFKVSHGTMEQNPAFGNDEEHLIQLREPVPPILYLPTPTYKEQEDDMSFIPEYEDRIQSHFIGCIIEFNFTGVIVQLEIKSEGGLIRKPEQYPLSTDLVYCSGIPLRTTNYETFDYSLEQTPLSDVCGRIEKFVLISGSSVTGIDPIQPDYCSYIGGRSLNPSEFEKLKIFPPYEAMNNCKQVWGSKSCEVFDLETYETVRTCFPSNACFFCFVPIDKIVITDFKSSKKTNAFEVDIKDADFIEMGETDGTPHQFMLKSPESTVTYENGTWNLKFQDIRDAFHLTNSPVPFGVKEWHSSLGNYTQKFLILSCLNQEMCYDGMCYNSTKRCNRKLDCRDRSDENYCNNPYVVKREFAVEMQDQICDKYHGDFELQVHYKGNIVDLRQEDSGIDGLKIRAEMDFKWRDPRLKFFATAYPDSMSGSRLLFQPARDLVLMQCKTMKQIEANISNSVFSSNLRHHKEFKQWGVIDGEDITLTNEFTVEFFLPCNFNYSYFPFGGQSCQVCFKMENCNSKFFLKQHPNATHPWTFTTEGTGGLRLDDICPMKDQNSSRVMLDIILASKYVNMHLLTSFAPTFLMCIVSFISLFINIDSVGERISISSGALLTLAVHYSTVSDNIVNTHEIKLIDLWFIGCIALAAFIVFVNATLPYMAKEWIVNFKISNLNIVSRRSKEYNMEGSNVEIFSSNKSIDDPVSFPGMENAQDTEDVQRITVLRRCNYVARVIVFTVMVSCFILFFVVFNLIHVFDSKCLNKTILT